MKDSRTLVAVIVIIIILTIWGYTQNKDFNDSMLKGVQEYARQDPKEKRKTFLRVILKDE